MGKTLFMYCLILGTMSPLVAQNQNSVEINSAVSFISNNYRGIVNPSYTFGRKITPSHWGRFFRSSPTPDKITKANYGYRVSKVPTAISLNPAISQ